MPSQDSRPEYTRRMHRVLEYIDRHIDQPLELETLAGVANFSSFHFHRLFTAWMGETFGEYLRRRRLELAAMYLVAQPRLPVLQVALSVGFGSAEAFARAFKSRFGESPTTWRSSQVSKRDQVIRNRGQAGPASPIDHEVMNNKPIASAMDVRIIERQPTTVAYLRHVGPYGKPLSDFWEKTVYPWMATNNLLGRPRYGISHDDPGITAPEKLRYDAAVEVPGDFAGAGQYMTTVIPGGTYAAGKFRGTDREIGPAWESMLRDWLPGSGMQLGSRPLFEYYSPEASYDAATRVFNCEIVIPIEPL